MQDWSTPLGCLRPFTHRPDRNHANQREVETYGQCQQTVGNDKTDRFGVSSPVINAAAFHHDAVEQGHRLPHAFPSAICFNHAFPSWLPSTAPSGICSDT